ncbi:LysR family transcriptional regulator [Roseovarius sp.]|uniref:LysR family transcriptional regulator n=1 Tax=Roseovarius sp. TaxID=1486281 RepID=UPI00351320C3
MPQQIKIEWLVAFNAVLLTGTITDAAVKVLRTQPQVSRMIRALEEATGLNLFKREGRRLIPTPAALGLAEYIAPTLKMLDGLEAFAEDTRQRRNAPLVACAEPFFMQALVPAALEQLAPAEDRRFGIDLCLRRIGLWHNHSDADFAIVALPFPQTDFHIRPFAEAETLLVTPPGHPLADQERVDISQIADQPFIALRPTTLLRARIDERIAAASFRLQPRLETDSGSLAVDLASRGIGLTIADPLVTLAQRQTGIGMVRLDPPIHLRYGFLLRSSDPSPAVERALGIVSRTAVELGQGLVTLL